MFSQYPDVRIVTCAVDEGLNDAKYIVPVELLQEFNDRVWAIMGTVTSILPTNDELLLLVIEFGLTWNVWLTEVFVST